MRKNISVADFAQRARGPGAVENEPWSSSWMTSDEEVLELAWAVLCHSLLPPCCALYACCTGCTLAISSVVPPRAGASKLVSALLSVASRNGRGHLRQTAPGGVVVRGGRGGGNVPVAEAVVVAAGACCRNSGGRCRNSGRRCRNSGRRCCNVRGCSW